MATKLKQKAFLKIPYKEFIQSALEIHKENHPYLKPETVKFIKISNDGDHECYENPDYIEVEIEL